MKKISDKDKKAWQNFVNSREKVLDKDLELNRKDHYKIEKSIDLHGYNLNDANLKIERFILSCFDKKVTKINVITGRGNRSINNKDPYQSQDLSILKYSVPNFIKENKYLMEKILKIDFEAVKNPSQGSFNIFLKKND